MQNIKSRQLPISLELWSLQKADFRVLISVNAVLSLYLSTLAISIMLGVYAVHQLHGCHWQHWLPPRLTFWKETAAFRTLAGPWQQPLPPLQLGADELISFRQWLLLPLSSGWQEGASCRLVQRGNSCCSGGQLAPRWTLWIQKELETAALAVHGACERLPLSRWGAFDLCRGKWAFCFSFAPHFENACLRGKIHDAG